MRREMTVVEALVWDAIRGRRVDGLKFRRQAPIGPYIADFYCPAIRLVVEIDGAHHDLQVEADAARTRYLESKGCRVIRIRSDNDRLLVEDVVEAILAACRVGRPHPAFPTVSLEHPPHRVGRAGWG
jgi:very-short-patch-repair endonuclease